MYRRFDVAADSSKSMYMAGQGQPVRNPGSFAPQSQGNINRQGANMSRQAGGNPQGAQTQGRHHEGASQTSHNRAARPEENINGAERSGRAAQNQSTENHGTAERSGQSPQRDGCGKEKHNQAKLKPNFLKGLLPSSLYDQKSKKIFGILSAEDLLLVALIFLFLEKDDGDNTIMVLALVYVLISDYINLPDFVL